MLFRSKVTLLKEEVFHGRVAPGTAVAALRELGYSPENATLIVQNWLRERFDIPKTTKIIFAE